ncbi:putative lrr receptor-like serine/threonine-protein kinase [Quercus suber]|uniref:non-specific serine/threonine protein kinase n=1 Tax=Quercus suber TaxID=58331 RepID=A0AAW0KAT3_QUESU
MELQQSLGGYNTLSDLSYNNLEGSLPSWVRDKNLQLYGKLYEKDFDIRKEAGGASFVAVSKVYKVQVSENYLEIHLFWAGKGTCCVPAQDFTPTVSNNPPSNSKNRTGLIVGLVGVGVLSLLSVFMGTLNDGRVIAVKQLSVTSHQGKNQFITEIATISAVQHRNLVKLYGCCIEGDKRLLVYEYLENKSLDQALFEYAMRGHLTKKADVFAFGVVALELVSGRPNSDSSLEEKIYLLEWNSMRKNQASPTLRPSMSRVVAMLSGDIEVSTVTSRPGYLTDWKYDDIANVTSEGATEASYFN